MKTIERLAYPIVLSVALLLVVLALLSTLSGGANAQAVCYSPQGGAMRVAGSGCEYEFQDGAVIDLQGNSRTLEQAATLAITDGTEIGSVYGLQSVSMSVNSTATLTTTGYVAGDVLKFYNPSPTYTLTIADSSPVMASGNIALAQYDYASLWFDGSYWIQTGESDN